MWYMNIQTAKIPAVATTWIISTNNVVLFREKWLEERDGKWITWNSLVRSHCSLSMCACLVVHFMHTCGMSVDKNVPVCETNQHSTIAHSVQGNCASAWKVLEWEKEKLTWLNPQQRSDGISCVRIFPRYSDLNIKMCWSSQSLSLLFAGRKLNNVIVCIMFWRSVPPSHIHEKQQQQQKHGNAEANRKDIFFYILFRDVQMFS